MCISTKVYKGKQTYLTTLEICSRIPNEEFKLRPVLQKYQLQRSVKMDTSNVSTFVPIQPLSQQISIMDVFFPGFSSTFRSTYHLLAGDSDIYIRLLVICGMITFLARYSFRYLKEFVETYFSL